MASDLEKLNRILGTPFDNPGSLRLALTHRSYGADNNERLEFLGDSILNYIIAQDLYRRFPQAREGRLSRMRAQMVKQETLADVAREFRLGDYLIMGSGELKSGGFNRDSILSDALEAVIGAVFVERGMDYVGEMLIDWFEPRLANLSPEAAQKDAKTLLQEYLQSRSQSLPEYLVVEVAGKSHDQEFRVKVISSLLPQPVFGEGRSRRKAEQDAAARALELLGVDI